MRELTKRERLLGIGLLAVFVIYTVVVFLVFGYNARSLAFWFSYWFTLVAFGLNILAVMVLFRRSMTARDWFLGFPVLRDGYIYLGLQFVASVVFMAIPHCSWAIAVAVQAVILAVYLVFAISGLVARETIEQLDTGIATKVRFVRTLQADLTVIAQRCTDAGVKKQVSALADKARYSDPMSSDALAGLEQDIMANVASLGDAVDRGDMTGATALCVTIERGISERNTRCKLLK